MRSLCDGGRCSSVGWEGGLCGSTIKEIQGKYSSSRERELVNDLHTMRQVANYEAHAGVRVQYAANLGTVVYICAVAATDTICGLVDVMQSIGIWQVTGLRC